MFISILTIVYPLSILGMIIIDYFLGEKAEYFNAWAVLLEFGHKLGASIHSQHYILYQEKLGEFALPIAIVVFFIEPLIAALALSGIIYLIAKYI